MLPYLVNTPGGSRLPTRLRTTIPAWRSSPRPLAPIRSGRKLLSLSAHELRVAAQRRRGLHPDAGEGASRTDQRAAAVGCSKRWRNPARGSRACSTRSASSRNSNRATPTFNRGTVNLHVDTRRCHRRPAGTAGPHGEDCPDRRQRPLSRRRCRQAEDGVLVNSPCPAARAGRRATSSWSRSTRETGMSGAPSGLRSANRIGWLNSCNSSRKRWQPSTSGAGGNGLRLPERAPHHRSARRPRVDRVAEPIDVETPRSKATAIVTLPSVWITVGLLFVTSTTVS